MPPPLDLTDRLSVWEERWTPRPDRFLEPFAVWWARNAADFAYLHQEVLEQWVYRHWTTSPYTFLPVSDMVSRLETWPSSRFLAEIECDIGPELDAAHDHALLRTSPIAQYMNVAGTWKRAIVVLHSESGFINGSDKSVRRYWLIEGHQRFRYLNALCALGIAKPRHQVFVLELAAAPSK